MEQILIFNGKIVEILPEGTALVKASRNTESLEFIIDKQERIVPVINPVTKSIDCYVPPIFVAGFSDKDIGRAVKIFTKTSKQKQHWLDLVSTGSV